MANDRIVQIGAVSMRGPVILNEPRIDTRVDPGVPISAASIRIHGITDRDVAGAPKLAEMIESLAKMLAGQVVIGQNIRFDLAVLRHEAAQRTLAFIDCRGDHCASGCEVPRQGRPIHRGSRFGGCAGTAVRTCVEGPDEAVRRSTRAPVRVEIPHKVAGRQVGGRMSLRSELESGAEERT